VTKKPIRLLFVVGDGPETGYPFREMFKELAQNNVELTQANSIEAAEVGLEGSDVDVILLYLGPHDPSRLEEVRRAHATAPRVPLVVITDSEDESMATLVLQEGAQDYLVKGQFGTLGLLRALRYAIERKTMEEALFVEKERAQVTLNSIGDAVVCMDIAGNVTFLNLVAEKIMGWSWEEAAGRPIADVFRILDATSRKITPNLIEMAVGENRTVHLPANCILVRRDGIEIPIEDSVAPIHNRDKKITGAVIIFRDVSAARSMEVQMTHAAEHDSLTDLPNRMLLNDRIRQAITLARRRTRQIAVLFLDLDGFKHINDSLGHPFGDKLLQSVAKRLVDCVRDSDTVSRQGGDEFIVLLADLTRPDEAALTAKRMLERVAEAHSIDQHDLHIDASIGVSIYPDDGPDAETLIKNADVAMYQAKVKGRQSYQFFKPAMNVRAVERQSIEEDLRHALERREISLLYQPKVNLQSGEITGAEALIRWTHPVRGLVSPETFIPVAEDCGLILPLGRWVLHEACTQARIWMDAGLPQMTMAVNISAMEFRDDGFLDGVFAILENTGLDPRFLELELTESILMEHAESAESVLKALRKIGVRVALDDFGTGYSSLSYLQKFPIDALKVDQSFVRQIAAATGETSIVTAVIAMARSLKLRVIAEGVETAKELTFLRSLQCDEAQGFFFCSPALPEQFARLLRDGIPQLARRKRARRGLARRIVAANGGQKRSGRRVARV
jgi:diguanylate cyclase (GGDEF)-like protein/PAS domain S-box-containing protein